MSCEKVVKLTVLGITQDRRHNIDTTSIEASPIPTPETSQPSSPANLQALPRRTGPGGRLSRRARKAVAVASTAVTSSGDESGSKSKKSGSSSKTMRKWGADGLYNDNTDDFTLDYSSPSTATTLTSNMQGALEKSEGISPDSWGKRIENGEFVLKDLDHEMDAIIAGANFKKPQGDGSGGIVSSRLGAVGSLFRSIVKGKVISEEDLKGPLKGMEDHLLMKNVAREAAIRICDSVRRDLLGVRMESFTSTYLP